MMLLIILIFGCFAGTILDAVLGFVLPAQEVPAARCPYRGHGFLPQPHHVYREYAPMGRQTLHPDEPPDLLPRFHKRLAGLFM